MSLKDRLANLEHPPVFSLHDDDSTIGGPHPIPGAVFNINLLKRHSAVNPVRAPLREGADKTFTYINNLDYPRTLEGGEIGKFASACLNPLSTKIGDLVNFDALRSLRQYRAHEAVYDGLEALTGAYVTARNQEDVEPMLETGQVVMVRHVEGLHLPKDPRLGFQMVDRMIESGVRSVGLMWNEPTELGTTCYYEKKKMPDNGLSSYGEDVVKYLIERDIIIDLSHSSPNTMRDILKIAPAEASIIASHIASKRLNPHARNIFDDLAQEVAQRGKGEQKGVVGVPFVRTFVIRDTSKPVSIWDVVAHIQDFRQILGGVDNIGLGPDFGGTMSGSRIPGVDDIAVAGKNLATALRETREFSEDEIAQIFSGNAVNYIKQNLPSVSKS